MPTTEILRANDEALHEMYKADTAQGELSHEDADAYQQLIEAQRTSHLETHIEVKDADSGKVSEITVHNIGDAALQNSLVVHSDSWHTDKK